MNQSESLQPPSNADQPAPDAAEIREWIRQVDEWYQRLLPQFPHIDPHDLRMMIRSILQPKSVPRRWLLRKTEDGRYVL